MFAPPPSLYTWRRHVRAPAVRYLLEPGIAVLRIQGVEQLYVIRVIPTRGEIARQRVVGPVAQVITGCVELYRLKTSIIESHSESVAHRLREITQRYKRL